MILKCPVCQSEPKSALSRVKDWEYEVGISCSFNACAACKLLVISPMLSTEELKGCYPDDYHGFHTTNSGITSFLYRIVYFFRFREYRHLVGDKANILDVGCADAPYFDLLNKCYPEMSVTGVEFKNEIAERGRIRGRNIITGTIQDIDRCSTFDLINMNNLIEHVTDPYHELKKAYELLRTGGHLIIETPNADSWDYVVAGRFWGGLHAPRHTYIFSTTSIKALAFKAGFKLKDVKFLLNTDHWALSVQNFLQSTDRFRVKLKNGRAYYYRYLLFIFIPLNILQMVFKKTGSIRVILKK